MMLPDIGICHGQNCCDVGGSVLREQLHAKGIVCAAIACQSLCAYAPTAKVNGIAVLRADMDAIVQRIHA